MSWGKGGACVFDCKHCVRSQFVQLERNGNFKMELTVKNHDIVFFVLVFSSSVLYVFVCVQMHPCLFNVSIPNPSSKTM